MKREDIESYNYIIIALVVVLVGAVFFFRIKNQEVYFARSALYGLAKGNLGVVKQINWPIFRAFDNNTCQYYNNLPNEREKNDFQVAFVHNFSRGFRAAGSKLSSYTNWRVDSREPGLIIVAVDDTAHNKTALLFISTVPKHKLAGLFWKE